LILKKYLESLGKVVTLLFSGNINADEKKKHSFLPYFEEIKFEDSRGYLSSQKADILILIDGTNLAQFYNITSTEKVPTLDCYNKIIHIDHHQSLPEKLGTWTLQKQLSSTAEVILTEIVPFNFVTEKIATLGYAAIVGDTGNFRWAISKSTFDLSAKLVDRGADYKEVVDSFFFERSKLFWEMTSYVVNNLEYDEKLGSMFVYLPFNKFKNDLDSHKLVVLKDAFEEIARTVEGYSRGFLVYEEKPGVVVISSRGNNLRNKINLPEMLKELGGNGGGHANACRADLKGDFDKIVKDLKNVLAKSLNS
jgi:nanoRNase/pAp phosphatase (c-di-AMP/oligoRNAs hydrolase)